MAAKWGAVSFGLGAFAAIPIPASADVLNLSAAAYHVTIQGEIDHFSDSPTTASRNGTVLDAWGAAVSSGPGFAAATMTGTVNKVGDTVGDIVFESAAAEMIYYFGVQGTPGEHVPVDITFVGNTRSKAAIIDSGSVQVTSVINGKVEGPGVGYLYAQCSEDGGTSGVCSPPQSGSTTLEVTAGDQYEIDLVASITDFVACVGCVGIGNAYIDPYIQIDPSFAQADDFSLVISEGVPNVPVSVPESSTWTMMLVGFAGLAFAACKVRGVRPSYSPSPSERASPVAFATSVRKVIE